MTTDMTQEPTDASSSAATELSSMEWDDILALGRSIVSQLQIEEHDTLGRWMSYRLAERPEEADHEPNARDSVADLTLRLWSHRSDWPNGWRPRE